MCEPVGNNEILCVQLDVVSSDLFEHSTGDMDVGSLVFDDHAGAELAVVEDAVGPQVFLSDAEGDLVGQQRGGVAKAGDEPVREVLAHPFLGREGYPAAAKRVEHLAMAVLCAQLYVEWGKI